MAHVAMTGANGFLGWHTRTALLERDLRALPVVVGDSFSLEKAAQQLSGAERAIHIAGVNRAENDELVRDGNLLFAEQLSQALRQAEQPPAVLVFANSSQSLLGNVYGESKRQAAEILAETADQLGITFEDVVLPNLFGEHGMPFYNSVTSTFCHLLAEGAEPSVDIDKEMTLLHAQNAADLLTGSIEREAQSSLEVTETVTGLLSELAEISAIYQWGEIPDISTEFKRDLFNTYRSYTFESLTPIKLNRHADPRGSFFEIIRSHGGSGQSSFSTTVPGVSRGDHFHRRKVERFTVLSGTATISLRKLFSDRVFHFEVDGETPHAVDMPTGWSHKITNMGSKTLFTSFWSNDIFDPAQPDTIAEAV